MGAPPLWVAPIFFTYAMVGSLALAVLFWALLYGNASGAGCLKRLNP